MQVYFHSFSSLQKGKYAYSLEYSSLMFYQMLNIFTYCINKTRELVNLIFRRDQCTILHTFYVLSNNRFNSDKNRVDLI